jgi:hypothetical protein
MARAEAVAIVLTPLVALATFAVGLRVGASKTVDAATIFGAPPAAGREGLAWQILTVHEDRGVREAVALPDITVQATSGGHEATWRGATNADGIAEAWLPLPGVHRGDAVDLVVRAAGVGAPLAQGEARWVERPWGADVTTSPWVRPSKREGDLAIDVAVLGDKLAPGFASPFFIRVVDRSSGEPALASVEVEPEPGLLIPSTHVTTCNNGLAELTATAQVHVVALGIRATSTTGRSGQWYGAIPVAPGGSFVALPLRVAPETPLPFRVLIPTVRTLAYVEIDDRSGRAFAAAAPVASVDRGLPYASTEIPPLTAGVYWIVTSGEPRGAESLAVGTIARPLLVEREAPRDECALAAQIVAMTPGPFERWVALDGTGRGAADEARRRRGLALAFGALVVGALAETLLVLGAAARARHDLERIAAEMDDAGPVALSPKTRTVNVIVGVLLAVLGFALLASLLTWHAG